MEEPIEVSLEVARIFEQLGIEYLVGGSFASSLHGHPRSTQDIDFVADLRPEHVAVLASLLHGRFYFDEPAILDAVTRRSTFNVIHLRTLFKVDVFVASPEDIVVQKLHWYRLGDYISERQWLDAMNVLTVRGSTLDQGYMHELAAGMGVDDLLVRAFREAGLEA